MIRNTQRGEGRLKTIVSLAIVAAIIFLAFKIIPIYVDNYELEDAMKSEARFAAVNRKSPDDVRDAVYRKIQELRIPARREDIRIEQVGTTGLRITVTYTVIIDFTVYQWKKEMSASGDNMSV